MDKKNKKIFKKPIPKFRYPVTIGSRDEHFIILLFNSMGNSIYFCI